MAVCGTVREEVTTTIQIIWVNNSKLSIWHLFSTKSFLLDAGELAYKCCWTDFRHKQIAIICWQTGCWQNDMLAKQLAFLHTTRGLSIKDDCGKTILQKELVFLTHWWPNQLLSVSSFERCFLSERSHAATSLFQQHCQLWTNEKCSHFSIYKEAISKNIRCEIFLLPLL